MSPTEGDRLRSPAAPPAPAPDDPRVVRALEDYSAALKAGRRPDRHQFQARYPEIAEVLAECLEALEFVQAAAPRLHQPAAEFQPEGLLGDFRILREIGRGGMGVVYEAVQISLGRRVALKVLPFASALDARQLQRFTNEAQAAAHLHHQNIVPVFGVGCDRGVHYYAMQLIEGQTLAALIEELRQHSGLGAEDRERPPGPVSALARELVTGKWLPLKHSSTVDQPTASAAPCPTLPPARVADASAAPTAARSTERSVESPAFFRTVANLGVQAAEGLEHAHQLGVVHRDVKPANLLVDLRGNLWITDFGLAHCQSQAGLTLTGDLMGTLRYMSPEQALAQRALVDHRTDVYSLGATLYELLTREPVFDGRDRQELLRQIAFEEPKMPRRWNRSMPGELETIVLKALEKNPADRYATAQELADDLGRFLRDESIRAKRPSLLQRVRKWARRHQAIVWSALGAVLAVLLVAVGMLAVSNRRIHEEQQRTQLALGEKTELLWQSYLNQARASRLSRRLGQRFETLAVLAKATALARDMNLPEADFLKLRNETIACLALVDVRIAKEWDGYPASSTRMDFDGALERYARVDRAGRVSIRRVADDVELDHLVSGMEGAWPRLSPDGRFLALGHQPRYELWRLDGREPVRLAQERGCTASDFSSDSRWAAVVHTDGAISLYDLPSGRCARQLKPGTHPVHSAAFHPDGRRLAVSHGAGVQVRDLDTGNVLANLPQAGAEHLAWAPGGKMLAVVGADRAIHLWDVPGRREVGTLRRWKNAGLRITFSHGGEMLASIGREQMLRLWDLRTGEELFHTPAGFAGAPLHFRADDHLLAADVKEDKFRLWEIVPCPESRRLIRNPDRGQAPYGPFAVSRDGRVLAARTPDGFGLWSLREGAPLAVVPGGALDSVLFEPSGALLTAGPAGIRRWPLRPDPASAGVMRLGPPQRLPLSGTPGAQIACSGDSRVVAAAQGWGALVWHAGHPDRPVRLAPHEGTRTVAVSPDGRWVATGSRDGAGAQIWEAGTGQPVKDLLPQEGCAGVRFSPDGRWLATGGNGLRLWAAGSWQEGPSLGGIPGAAFAFSPAEKLLAVETGFGAIRLVDPDTGREYARLEDPDQVRATWICFSPDGTQLLAAGGGEGAWIRAWDLRAIRRQLAERDLDWDLPPYPPAEDAAGAPPLRVKVELGPRTD